MELETAAEEFRSAIQTHNVTCAEGALREYVAWFDSHSPSPIQLEAARDLLEWAIRVTRSHQARLSEELKLLEGVFNAYRPDRRINTWRLQA